MVVNYANFNWFVFFWTAILLKKKREREATGEIYKNWDRVVQGLLNQSSG